MTAKAAGKTGSKSVGKAKRPRSTSGNDTPGGAGLWWAGLGCGATLVLSPGTAILVAVLVAPVLLVAILPEDGPGRRVALASLLFGLAGSVPALRQLWNDGATVEAALAIIHQPMALLTAWVAVLAGWFTSEIAGIVLRLIADMSAAAKRRSCTAALAALEEEWGGLPPTVPVIPK